MRKPMEWGGDIEVIAMQEVFGVRIVIYSSSAPNPVRARVRARDSAPPACTCHAMPCHAI